MGHQQHGAGSIEPRGLQQPQPDAEVAVGIALHAVHKNHRTLDARVGAAQVDVGIHRKGIDGARGFQVNHLFLGQITGLVGCGEKTHTDERQAHGHDHLHPTIANLRHSCPALSKCAHRESWTRDARWPVSRWHPCRTNGSWIQRFPHNPVGGYRRRSCNSSQLVALSLLFRAILGTQVQHVKYLDLAYFILLKYSKSH
jgi:hypothetical protein